MKKYQSWEIVVALLAPLLTLDQIWHRYHDPYPSTLYQLISHVFDFVCCAILIYLFYRMYLGARQSSRFPKLMLFLLISVAASKLFSFSMEFIPCEMDSEFEVPTLYIVCNAVASALILLYGVVLLVATIRFYKERLKVLAVTCTVLLAIPLLSNILFSCFTLFISFEEMDKLTIIVDILSCLFSLSISACYAVLFLHRNDLYRPESEPTT